jgi:cellulose 1,4-beta-cellobiosidase
LWLGHVRAQLACKSWCSKWTCMQQSDCGSCAACMPSPPPAPLAGINPFAGVDLLVSNAYATNVQQSVDAAGGPDNPLGSALSKAAGIPTAVWIDEMAALPKMRAALKQAQAQQRATGTDVLCVFVVYNLPGRDCSAASSAGELATGQLDRYESEFIGGIASLAMEYEDVPKVFLLEPDSLPNVVTNMNRPRCTAAASEYTNGIALAIRHLGPLGAIYIDAGWSGWIGSWSAARMAQVMAQVLDLAGDAARHVRGFVTNVSNYGTVSAEAGYANTLRASLASLGHSNLAFVVDTGRNAGSQMGGTWCNPKGAGMGPPPTSNPGVAFADAFFWIKPPGESDGISTPGSPRFDPKCGQQGVSWSGAPEAGEWFGESFTELVQKAKPPLASAPTYTRHFVLQPNPPPTPPRPSRPPLPLPSPPLPQPVWSGDFIEQQPVIEQQQEMSEPSEQLGMQEAWQTEVAVKKPVYGLAHPGASHFATATRRPPPPSPSPPPPSATMEAPSKASTSKGKSGPSSNTVTLAMCVAILALLSLIKGGPGGDASAYTMARQGAPDEVEPSLSTPRGRHLPEHVLQQARAARCNLLAKQANSSSSVGRGAHPPRPSGLRQPTRAEEPAKQRARTRPELELDAHGEPPPTAAAAQENDSEVLRQARIAVALIKETQLQQARENERRQPPSPPAVCTTPAPSTGNCTSSSVEVDPEGIGGLSASQLAAAGW